MTYAENILRALNLSLRSARDVSIAATGHESAIRSLRRGLDLRASTIDALCRELGLEFYVGPPRRAAVPEPITETLGLAPDATMEEAVAAIGALAATALESPSTGAPSDMAPVKDRRVAEMMAALADAWEEAGPRSREDLAVRWRTHFPDLADRALSLRGRH